MMALADPRTSRSLNLLGKLAGTIPAHVAAAAGESAVVFHKTNAAMPLGSAGSVHERAASGLSPGAP